MWGQKAPPKHENGGKKRPRTNQSRKSVGQKVPSKCKSGGKKRHHISNCGGTLTTTYHIQGAGAPAKTKNYVNADAFIFFREKVRPFPHLAKPVNTTIRKEEKAMVQIKRDWFCTALENYKRGETHGRWKEKIQV